MTTQRKGGWTEEQRQHLLTFAAKYEDKNLKIPWGLCAQGLNSTWGTKRTGSACRNMYIKEHSFCDDDEDDDTLHKVQNAEVQTEMARGPRINDRKLNQMGNRMSSCHLKDGKRENRSSVFPWRKERPTRSRPILKRILTGTEDKSEEEPADPTCDPDDHSYANPCQVAACKETILALRDRITSLEVQLAEAKRKAQQYMASKPSKDKIHNAGGYGSEFDYDSELEARRAKRKDLSEAKSIHKIKVPSSREVTQEYTKEESKTHRFHFLSLDAYSRHKKMINDYMLYYGGHHGELQRDTSRDKTDMDVIRENHQFLWEEDEDAEHTWEKRLAKKYYDKLFKEYCISDLSRYKENKVAMRWRIEKEVLSGKGQFSCGTRNCQETEGLRSWEVNFGYIEQGEKKNALVKLRLCPDCSYKLNYHHKKREVKAKRKSGSPKLKPVKKQKTRECSEDKEAEEQMEGNDSNLRTVAPSGEGTSSQAADDASNIWSGPAKIVEEKSRDEEFEDYFEDMFL